MSALYNALVSGHCAANAPALDSEGVAKLGRVLPDWSVTDGALVRSYTFDDFHHTMAFVNAVAWIAHREDHHPDLDVGYGRCTLRWSTHSAGGITRNDFICAARVEALVNA
ncbi:MAG TPA: 4a-hydroxytetrahydrobiopterin dehydratase [Casimicrobiaceae bacterium]